MSSVQSPSASPTVTETKSVSFDAPVGTVLWLPFPKLVYTLGVEQRNRIKLALDTRNGSYVLVFILVDWSAGEEKETELHRMIFPDKTTAQQFKENFIQAFTNQGL